MIRFFVSHPVATWMIFAALMVCSLYAVPRLDIEAMPDVQLPQLVVTTSWSGASPAAIQRAITLPIEEAAARCRGVERLESISRHGYSQVSISYQRETDIEFARLELNEFLGNIRRHLPSQAGQPHIRGTMPADYRDHEFFSVALLSPLPPNELRQKAEDWLQPAFLAVDGVAQVDVLGGAQPLLRVRLNRSRMERYNLTADIVGRRLRQRGDILCLGSVRQQGQQLTVSVHDSVTTDDLAATVLRHQGGQPIRLSHVADIEGGFEDVTMFRRINGQNVVALRMERKSGANTVTVSRRLHSALPEIQAAMPFPVTFMVDQDEGKALREKLEELVLRSASILGLLFVLLSLALRRIRLVGIVISSIVFAIVICLSLFYFFDVSVNFITISGLTICFGMLLDNSILVLDSVHRQVTQRRRQGVRQALIKGTQEVSFPIIATTLTTVVGFLGFAYLNGRLALTYVPLAVSVAFAMAASIFVAFCWMPVALQGAARSIDRPNGQPTGPTRIGKMVHATTRIGLRFWPIPLLLLLGLLLGTWHVYDTRIIKGGWWQPPIRENLYFRITHPVGTDVLLASETMKLFEAELLPVPEGIKMSVWSRANTASMHIEFETDEVFYSAYPLLFRNRIIVLAEEMSGLSMVLVGFGNPYLRGSFGGISTNSGIVLTGYNTKDLEDISDGVLQRLNRNRRARNIHRTSSNGYDTPGQQENLITIDRDILARHHLTMTEVVLYLQRLLNMDYPWHMTVEGRNQQVQLGFISEETSQFDNLCQQTLTTAGGEQVSLGEVITLESRPQLSSIARRDQRYTQTINWEYIGTAKMQAACTREILAGIDLPYGFTAEDRTERLISQEEEEELLRTILLTILFITMTLAALTESLALPLLVLLSLPMALVGVVAIFWATSTAMDSSAQIGMVLMFGIVVNNAILLINRYRLMIRELVEDRRILDQPLGSRSRLGGLDLWPLPADQRRSILRDAIVQGTGIQLRSILLASGTTVAGLIPLLIEFGRDSGSKDIWENLALATIGGLTSSTILLLATMPALYWMFTRLGWILKRLRPSNKTGLAPMCHGSDLPSS